jgi:hypothetical protein
MHHHNSPAAIRARIAQAKGKPVEPPVLAPPTLTPESLASLRKITAEVMDPNFEVVRDGDDPPEVRFQCGHTRPVASFKSEACPDCRGKARAKKQAKRKDQDERRRAAQAAAGSPVLGRAEQQGRLPDRSRFVTTYDAGRVLWAGVLELADGRHFQGEGSSVEGLMRELARQCREAGEGK